jgi:DNA-directed RNA polymerase specialized sigma subunit
MFETYRKSMPKYPKLSIDEERRLIAQAKRGDEGKADEFILRHIGFIIFRINKIIFPIYRDRFSEDILSQLVLILYDKIQSYDLNYKDKEGNPKPVRFSSYVWKRIDGFIIDYLKKELARERQQQSLSWERFEEIETVSQNSINLLTNSTSLI